MQLWFKHSINSCLISNTGCISNVLGGAALILLYTVANLWFMFHIIKKLYEEGGLLISVFQHQIKENVWFLDMRNNLFIRYCQVIKTESDKKQNICVVDCLLSIYGKRVLLLKVFLQTSGFMFWCQNLLSLVNHFTIFVIFLFFFLCVVLHTQTFFFCLWWGKRREHRV